MPNIPNIKKFKGVNEVSFNKWILPYEAQNDAIGVENNRKRQMLLCCLEDSAFTLASQRINAANDTTYDNLKAALAEAFSGEDYKRMLKTRARNLKFAKDTNINLFCNSLRTLVRELYNLTDLGETYIDAITINRFQDYCPPVNCPPGQLPTRIIAPSGHLPPG